jgi:hypothetical protein
MGRLLNPVVGDGEGGGLDRVVSFYFTLPTATARLSLTATHAPAFRSD